MYRIQSIEYNAYNTIPRIQCIWYNAQNTIDRVKCEDYQRTLSVCPFTEENVL